jgi:DNA-binding MarR family transcriptional regulator
VDRTNFDEAALCRAVFGQDVGLASQGVAPEIAVPLMVAATGIAFERMRVQSRRLVSANRSERVALMTLWERGPSTVGELSASLDISKSAMSQVVDRLVDLGWAERSKDPDDRRRTIVALTPKAFEATMPFWFAVARPIAQGLAEGLSAEQAHAVLAGYRIVHEALTAAFERFSALSEEEMIAAGEELARECRALLAGAGPTT